MENFSDAYSVLLCIIIGSNEVKWNLVNWTFFLSIVGNFEVFSNGCYMIPYSLGISSAFFNMADFFSFARNAVTGQGNPMERIYIYFLNQKWIPCHRIANATLHLYSYSPSMCIMFKSIFIHWCGGNAVEHGVHFVRIDLDSSITAKLKRCGNFIVSFECTLQRSSGVWERVHMKCARARQLCDTLCRTVDVRKRRWACNQRPWSHELSCIAYLMNIKNRENKNTQNTFHLLLSLLFMRCKS